MLVAGGCLLVLILVVCCRTGAHDPPMDADVIKRLRRCAEQIRREQLLPYE